MKVEEEVSHKDVKEEESHAKELGEKENCSSVIDDDGRGETTNKVSDREEDIYQSEEDSISLFDVKVILHPLGSTAALVLDLICLCAVIT